ncbi:hypothetical protein T190_02390 [Sinorhizobium meliloti CCBAU 01290]|nr:hypothetical protein T190_02390 [Sinorhizobium meliloti CCBAU 01290]
MPSESRSAAAIGFAEGTTGRTGLTPEEVENAVLNGTWGPVADVALEEALFGDLLTRGMTVVALSSGRRVLQDPDGKQYDTVAEARQAVEAPDTGPRLTIRGHYKHHKAMTDDLKAQLESQGYRVSKEELSFGSSCGTGRCRPDIVYQAPDGKWASSRSRRVMRA